MRVVVDYNVCVGNGQCEFAAPEVFTVDDEGTVEVLDETPPEAQRAEVEEAVRRCPTGALSMAEE